MALRERFLGFLGISLLTSLSSRSCAGVVQHGLDGDRPGARHLGAMQHAVHGADVDAEIPGQGRLPVGALVDAVGGGPEGFGGHSGCSGSSGALGVFSTAWRSISLSSGLVISRCDLERKA